MFPNLSSTKEALNIFFLSVETFTSKNIQSQLAKTKQRDTNFDILLTVHLNMNEMGGACGPYAGRERSIQGAGGETRGEETAG